MEQMYNARGYDPYSDYGAMLRQIWLEQNRPQFNASAGDAEAAAAKQRYLAETLNPQLGSVAVKDGPNPSSFASARQADLIAAGNRGSTEVSEIAKNSAYDRALKLYQIQLQQFNRDQDAGVNGRMGGSSSLNRRVANDGGNDPTDSTMGGRIAGGVFELGKRYLDAKQQGTFNPGGFGQAIGGGVRDMFSAPKDFASGLWKGVTNKF
jgi:hypothetical protein